MQCFADGCVASKVIGKGQSGMVYLVLKDGEYIARKVIPIPIDRLGTRVFENTKKEVLLLQQFNHRNLIHYYFSCFRPDLMQFWIDMEYCECGSLDCLLRKCDLQGTFLSNATVLRLFLGICQGVQFLHTNGITHRDLKPENIFLTFSGECVIGDVGLGRFCSAQELLVTRCGTPLFSSLEIYHQKPYTLKTDIWSLGCLFYALSANFPPNAAVKDAFELMAWQERPVLRALPPHIDPKVLELIGAHLLRPEQERMDIQELLATPLLQETSRRSGHPSHSLPPWPLLLRTRSHELRLHVFLSPSGRLSVALRFDWLRSRGVFSLSPSPTSSLHHIHEALLWGGWDFPLPSQRQQHRERTIVPHRGLQWPWQLPSHSPLH